MSRARGIYSGVTMMARVVGEGSAMARGSPGARRPGRAGDRVD
jgi:hypothetical protein